MKIIAHTRYGVFEGKSVKYSETEYKRIGKLLEYLPKVEYFSFETDTGEIYMTKEMIADTLFILEK
jgi:hypothetical protein